MGVVNYNINFKVDGGDKSGVTKTRIANKPQTKNPQNLTQTNLKNIVNVGVAFAGFQAGNELLGSYTEDRLRQKKMQVGMTFAKYAVGISLNPIAGTAYMAGDLAYRSVSYQIGVQKKSREADYFKRLSGNNANSGSRYRGDYV